MKKFILDLLLTVLRDPDVQKVVKQIIGDIVTERFLPVLPVLAATAAKAAVDQVVEKVPGMDAVIDLAKTADETRDRLADMLPDVDLPLIGNLSNFWKH